MRFPPIQKKKKIIGWVLQFTLSNLLDDIVSLPQIHFDGIEIDEVDDWESTKKKLKQVQVDDEIKRLVGKSIVRTNDFPAKSMQKKAK